MATPMTADAFIAALKAEGLTVHEVRSWRTHNRNGHGAWGPVNGVMLHHTGSSSLTGSINVCYDGRSDLPGPLCHGVIDKAGEVWLVGCGRANHAGGGSPAVLAAVVNEAYADTPPAPRYHEGSAGAADGNSHFYGFECINLGDGKDPWPDTQVQAMVKASAAICRAHRWGEKSTIGHLEWSDWKDDPRGAAVTMPGLRSKVAAALALPAGKWLLHPPAPKPTSTTTPKESTVATVQDLVNNLMTVYSLTEKTPDGKPVAHSAGYYLAHCHYDLVTLHKKVDALTALVQQLVDKSA